MYIMSKEANDIGGTFYQTTKEIFSSFKKKKSRTDMRPFSCVDFDFFVAYSKGFYFF